MKNHPIYCLLLCLLCINTTYSQSALAPPFSIELEEQTVASWPGLHSFAFGQWDGKWVFIAGRTNGLHGFFLATGFPPAHANKHIWVMDPVTSDYWSYDVEQLPLSLAEVLQSTNGQYTQNGQYLYHTGGYGKSLQSADFITYPTLTAIDLSLLVPAIINGQDPSAAFEQIEDERMRICGGEMLKMGAYYYLVGGNDFSGRYSDDETPEFVQVYSNQIRKFSIEHTPTGLSINDYSVTEDETNLHRRDFTLAPFIDTDGNEALACYGGVFRTDANLPFVEPIYIYEEEVLVDHSYAQKMSHYTCPLIPIYDAQQQNMYSIFFGGISWHYYDRENQSFVQDDLVPFIDDITVLTRFASGQTEEYVVDTQFDEYLGTNAKFILDENAPHFSNKVIDYEQIEERTLLGYIYGGIHAELRNFTPSTASNRLFAVYLTPSPALSIADDMGSFVLSCDAAEVVFDWVSTSDDVDFYAIEFKTSPLDENWQHLTTISATQKEAYSFKWSQTSLANYFRLKRVSKAGYVNYSEIQYVYCTANDLSLSLSPNPVQTSLSINFGAEDIVNSPIQMELFNAYGQLLESRFIDAKKAIDVSHLNKGAYLLRLLIDDGRQMSASFVKL